MVHSYLKDTDNLFDIDTGGSELLLSLNHSNNNSSATEGYPPKEVIKAIKDTINKEDFITKHKTNEKDFTRKRKLGFREIV